MNTLALLLRTLAVVMAAVVALPLRAAPVPTMITDDFSSPANWDLSNATAAGAMALADHRLSFTCPTVSNEASVIGFRNGPTLPVDRDWSVRCQMHIDPILVTTDNKWIIQALGVSKTSDRLNSAVGIQWFREHSDRYELSSLWGPEGSGVPHFFEAATTSPDVGLRIDYAAATRKMTFYLDNDAAGNASGWVLVGLVDVGQGTYNLNLTGADTFTLLLYAGAQNVAVTTGMAYFSAFEAVLDPGFALADYFGPAVAGTVSLYSGRDWDGAAAYSRAQTSDVAYNLDLYSGTTSPTQYFRPAIKRDMAYGNLVGGVFQSYDDWTEFFGLENGFGGYGDDDLPGESMRTPNLVIPGSVAPGQTATAASPVYDFGAYVGMGYLAFQVIGQESVTVPAGTFPDCLHIRFRLSLGSADDPGAQVTDEWWARGVGQVRRQGIAGGGARQLRELVSFTHPNLDPALKNVAVGGGSYSVTFTHAGSWLVDESLDWATVSATSGTGNASLTITVAPNSGLPRQGMINFGGTAHWIFQAGTNAPVFTANSVAMAVLPASSAYFNVVAVGTPAPTYRWQRLPAGSSTWANLSESATYTGTTSARLVVNQATLAMNGDQFRCVATNTAGSITGGSVGLGVSATASAVSSYMVSKERHYLQTDATALVIPATGAWRYDCKAVPANPNALVSGMVTLPPPAASPRTLVSSGSKLRLPTVNLDTEAQLDAAIPAGAYTFNLVTSTGSTVSRTFSYPVDAAYPAPVRILDYDALQSIDATAPFTAAWTRWVAGTDNDAYSIWIEDEGGNEVVFQNQPFAPESGGTGTSVTAPGGVLQPGRSYWLVVGPNEIHAPATREPAPDLVVMIAGTYTRAAIRTRAAAGAPPITAQPLAQEARVGTTATFTIAASGSGLTHRWLRLLPGAAGWSDLTASSTYTGVTTSTLTVSAVSLAMSGEQYRCVVTNGVGPNTSDAAKLTVHEETFITFGGWATGLFTPAQLADPMVSGPNADLGGTGASNLLRYAFGLPVPGTRLAGPVAPVTLVPFGGANYLSVAIHRKSYDPTLRYIVEGSPDLANWTTIATLLAGYPRDVAVRDTVATSAAARRFLRVRVEIVP